ncbi:hypothetical protein [Xinfangfangia pollutisoli]|uniref:hypothetical protein n=1 Tax=Xinfangfangia pollutisoli TaxID=2865960 RepID=UPI001CD394DA|nr:hypothetical protein [Xinfangfangia pollutisoli]
MRLPFLPPLVLTLLALAACGPGVGQLQHEETLDAVCAEQSALAQAGTTDGGQITITCP